MQFTVEYPLAGAGYAADYLEPAQVVRFAQAVEAAGFGAIAFTEHPAPSKRWLEAGGHEAFDPLTALAFCAGVTERLRLMTYLLVLPYRNPLLAAKSIATLDVLSGGRTTAVVGVGYLRSEFAALGVAFEERNVLFDEAVEAMTGIWATDGFSFQGRHFQAVGQVCRPRPVQQPHPPLWIGGNSRRSRQRAARYGQGWSPMLFGERLTQTSRTAAMSTTADLRAAIADLRNLAEQAGRDPATIDIQLASPEGHLLAAGGPLAAHRERLQELAALGVTWHVIAPPADRYEAALEGLARYGEEVIRPLSAV